MIFKSKKNIFKQIKRFSFTKSTKDSLKYFISKQEIDYLFDQDAKFELGVLCQPFTDIRFHEVLDKHDDCFTFYYKKTGPSQHEPQQVLDPQLKAATVQALKNNIENLLYTPIDSYTNSLGFRNFFDFSIEQDKQQVLEYNKMIKFLPFRIDGNSKQINQSFRKFDALIFEEGLRGEPHLPYKSMDLDEYSKHYEPDATPKTLPRIRNPSHVFTNYKRAVKELIGINAAGHYLPAWFFCLSFSLLPLTVGSPDLTWDRYDRDVYKLHSVKRVHHDCLSEPSKRNSLREMVDIEFTKNEKDVMTYHSNDMGFRPSNLTGDSQFMSQFDVICNSSQNNYTSPVKARPDLRREFGDGVNFHPESMDPEFVDLIEHKVHPIYASQSYLKNFFRYEDVHKYDDIDWVLESQMMYSKFFLSLVMRNKYKLTELQSDCKLTNNEQKAVKDAYKQYVSLVRELRQDLREQMIKNILNFEFEQNLQKLESQGNNTQSSFAEDSPLDPISSMADIDHAITYYNLTLIWK